METITEPMLLDKTGDKMVTLLGDIVNALGGSSSLGTFGFIEHMTTMDPSQRIEYIGVNKDYNPISITMGGGFDLGDWKNFKWLKDNKPYMVKKDGTVDYELDPDDYTKKKDGTASDVSNASYSGAGAFSWGDLIYKKETNDGTDRTVLFQFEPGDGFAPVGFTDPNGNTLKGRWIPMFYGGSSNSRATTVAGTGPVANQTTDAQKNLIDAVGSQARFFGGSFVDTLIDLMIMFAKTTDLQDFYGYGACNRGSQQVITQTVVSGGQFYGTGSSDKKNYNKIFHSVVLGSYMVYCRDPYEICASGTLKVSKDYTYDLTGATYENTGLTYTAVSEWKYPDKYETVDGYGNVPKNGSYGGTTATGGCDGFYVTVNETKVCLRFGNCYYDLSDGPRSRNWSNPASSSGWGLGFAVLLDPPVGYAA